MEVVIQGFLSETEDLLVQMNAAVSKDDFHAFKELVHTMKGSSGNMGAESLHQTCSQIMAMTEDELRVHGVQRMTLIAQRFMEVRKALRAFLDIHETQKAVGGITQ